MIEQGGFFFDGDMWKNPKTLPYNYLPGQMEIKYFFPLTEQIELDLDYSECGTRSLFTTTTIAPSMVLTSDGNGFVNSQQWTTNSFRLQENQTTMLVIKEPNFIRKVIYKLIGFKWEVN